MKFFIQICYIILLTFLLSPQIFSQSGKIAGKVTDATTGEELPFVNVIVMGTNFGAASDLEGNYFILNIPPGTYSVKASAIGYNSVTVQNIKVASVFT